MEYVQMTLNDWLELKHKLKMELQGVKQSFVRIGYALRKIDDQKLYEQDGYKSIAEFAKAEYGLEASTVSRFMSINRAYSINGYSEHLREEYLELGRSQLEEMLMLPDKDREMIHPETSREQIRELKRFNKQEPAAGEADEIHVLVEKFYEANEEILNELYSNEAITTEEVERLIEIVNPSGNKSFRKGLYFVMMYEENIKIKKHGESPQTMSWPEFFSITQEIFKDTAAGSDTYKNHFANINEEQIPGQMEINDYPEVLPESSEKTEKKEEIAPAQKSEESLNLLNEQGISKPQKREKTEEEKYDEQQRKIDRQTKKKLEEKEDEEKMSTLPSERQKPVYQIRLAANAFDDVASGSRSFELRKKDKDYKVGDILEMLEFKDAKHTGRTIKAEITYVMEDYTGLVDDYCILAIKTMEEKE